MKKLIKTLCITLAGVCLLGCKPVNVDAVSKKVEITKVDGNYNDRVGRIYVCNKKVKDLGPQLKKNKDGSYTVTTYEDEGRISLYLKNVPKNAYYSADIDKDLISTASYSKNGDSLGFHVLNMSESQHKKGKAVKYTTQLYPEKRVKYWDSYYEHYVYKYVKISGQKIKVHFVIKPIPDEDKEIEKMLKCEMGYKKSLSDFDKVLRAYAWVDKNTKYSGWICGTTAMLSGEPGSKYDQMCTFVRLCNVMGVKAIEGPYKSDYANVKVDNKWYIADWDEGYWSDMFTPVNKKNKKHMKIKPKKGESIAKEEHPYIKKLDSILDKDFDETEFEKLLVDKEFGKGAYERNEKLWDKYKKEGYHMTDEESEFHNSIVDFLTEHRIEVMDLASEAENKHCDQVCGAFITKHLKGAKEKYKKHLIG